MTQTQQLLTKTFPDLPWECNKPLAPLTYAKIGGPAEVYIELSNPQETAQVIEFCYRNLLSWTALGGASNVIIDDDGLPGLVLRYCDDTVIDKKIAINPNLHLVYIPSGTKTALAVAQTVKLGYSGLEYFLGVPGTIGGAIYNNAHYLSDLIDKHIHRVHALTKEGKEEWFTKAECAFAYEESRFQHKRELILGAEFALERGNQSVSQAKIAEATTYRAKTQPLGIPSSGCMFRNPSNTPSLQKKFPEHADRQFIPAGFLIEQAGLKGKRIGNIEVSQKHAAWLINTGDGTSADVRALVQLIKNRIHSLYGVELHEEVFFLPKIED